MKQKNNFETSFKQFVVSYLIRAMSQAEDMSFYMVVGKT